MGSPVAFGFGVRDDGRPWPLGGYAHNATVWEFAGMPNVLLRGIRLDGKGKLYFHGDGIYQSDVDGITVTDSSVGQLRFTTQLRLSDYSTRAFYLYPTQVGCYAMQADSNNFSEVVVFKAV